VRPKVEYAYSSAYSLLDKCGIIKPPIDVENIARQIGAVIARHHFDGSESGFALRDDRQTIIGVNTRTSRKRQRFTIAHEIGHLILHDGKPLIVDHNMRIDMRDDVSSIGTDDQEIEANAFGAALLMPNYMVIDRIKILTSRPMKVMSRDELISQLAKEFDVSGEAMGFRLINLGILAA